MNVVFDFDKTLTRRDSTRQLFFHLARRNQQSTIPYVAYYGLYRLGLWSEHRFKSSLIRRYVQGRSPADVAAAAAVFVGDLQDGHMNKTTLAALRRHLEAGDAVFVASANFEFLIRAFCETHDIPHYFATALETDGSRYTGDIKGAIVKGPEKLRRLESHFGSQGLAELKFYGDAEDRVLWDHIPNHVEVRSGS